MDVRPPEEAEHFLLRRVGSKDEEQHEAARLAQQYWFRPEDRDLNIGFRCTREAFP